jgi:hypothetical protein
MLFYAQKMPKKDLFAHASQYCTVHVGLQKDKERRERGEKKASL